MNILVLKAQVTQLASLGCQCGSLPTFERGSCVVCLKAKQLVRWIDKQVSGEKKKVGGDVPLIPDAHLQVKRKKAP
jgi:hypothetical protein